MSHNKRTTGDISIFQNSNGTTSVHWKITNFFAALNKSKTQYFLYSSLFHHQGKPFNSCLDMNFKNCLIPHDSYKTWLCLSVLCEDGTEINQFHWKPSIQNFIAEPGVINSDGSKYITPSDAPYVKLNTKFIMPVSVLVANKKKIAPLGDVIFFVDFIPKDRRLEPGWPHQLTKPNTTQKSVELLEQTKTERERKFEALSVLSQNLKDMYLNEFQSDTTIKVRERKFQVHKSIMIAHSPVFAAMLQHDMVERESHAVNVTDCDPDAFQAFLLYLYSGETETLSTGNVLGVYFIADKYNVDVLKVDCVDYIKRNLSVDNFCKVIELADRHKEQVLLEVLKKYFTMNARKILLTVEWQYLALKRENSALVNELLSLVIP